MRRVTMLVGAAFVAWGGYLFLSNTTWTSVRAALTWFLGGVILHDGVLVPVTLLAGAVLARLLPQLYRGLVQGALVLSATVTIALLPLLSGRGLDADDPSQQPLSYGRNLVVVLAIVWAVTAVLVLRRVLRAHAKPDPAIARAPA